MTPRRFDLIVFDWDGTLFDSTAIITRCIQKAVRDVDATLPSDQVPSFVIGLGLTQALAQAAKDVPQERLPDLHARYHHHYMAHQNDLSLFSGVVEMLATLKQNAYRLAIATGKSRLGLNQALQSVALQNVFDASRTADETRGKPHPLMLQELMDSLGVASARTLMIGDTTHDLQMAANAACHSVGVSYGAHAGQDLQRLQPLFVAPSVPALHHWLQHNA
jgi:phosphoglycolate phosphatase